MTSIAPPAPAKGRSRPGGSPWSWAWVALSSLAITGYFVGQYAQGTLDSLAHEHVGLAADYASRALPIRAAFYAHIVFAGLSLALGPWQFSKRLRNRSPRVHRAIGQAYLVSVAIGSVSGFVMSMFSSVGLLGFFGFGSLSVLWGWTAWRGYKAIRERDIRSHQAWMLRNFALTYAAVTLRSWFGVLILAQVPFTHGADPFDAILTQAYAPLPFLCWLPNIVMAEFMIRRRGLPALHITTPPSTRHREPSAQAAANGG
ncbi:putative membrane protein [Streptomyces griseochromogenes]|uniref:Membrane protein n=1 Tax=Streptomyces griseochromogenes TaxID=68214 RepID=A0A1B1AV63_9ACTN|nr:DUF2306 domain-containing protein [Streptomyces griseochromogenes]ANP50463.1 hypothetical protein AVL59_13290 [Streptomyces griseochromogenes]MBP2047826.1 putative membrane protein [Streptomyces griseochromogenes]